MKRVHACVVCHVCRMCRVCRVSCANGGGGGGEEEEEATPVDVWEAEAEGRAEAIMAGRVVRNDRWDREALLTALPGRTFVIPPRSAFLMVPPLLPPPLSLSVVFPT